MRGRASTDGVMEVRAMNGRAMSATVMEAHILPVHRWLAHDPDAQSSGVGADGHDTRPELPTLSPATQRACNELLAEGTSRNTIASYRSAINYLAAWSALRLGHAFRLPMTEAEILQFIVDHVERQSGDVLVHDLPDAMDQALVDAGVKAKKGPPALGTIKHHLAVLSTAHRVQGLPNPCNAGRVKQLWAATGRAYARRGVVPSTKDAITRETLQALLATCDASLAGIRDRALLEFGWSSGGRRRSEVALAEVRFLQLIDDDEYTYELRHSKTNPKGVERPDNFKPLIGETARSMRAWLQAGRITEGRIFRSITRYGRVGQSLSAHAINDIVHKRCELAGLTGNYSAHSLRAGFVTAATNHGAPAAQIMAFTGHRQVKSLSTYVHTASADQRRLAIELQEPP